MIQQRMISCLLTLSISLSLAFPSIASTSRRVSKRRNTPARLVVEPSEIRLSAHQTAEVKATVFDRRGDPTRNAKIIWTTDSDLKNVIRIKSANEYQTSILITAKDISSVKNGMLHARWGGVSSNVPIHLQDPLPREIVFPGGNRIELSVRGKETIRAYVLDGQGNRIRTSQVTWNLADPDHEAFVFVGRNVNKDGVNFVEIAWLPGKLELKVPSEVRLIARSDDVRGVVTIDYKGLKPEKVTLSLEPKQILIGPGESATVEVTARGEDQRLLKVDSEAEIADEGARKYLTVAVDKKTISIVGTYGDPKSPPPPFLRTALIVRAGGGTATIPVLYQRDPAAVDWDILPPNIVGDNYGRSIKKDYYCIEVTIQNNSGSDLALAGLRFYNGEFFRPNTSYSVVHGSLARRELTHPRSLTMAVVDSLGSLMTGFNPFFHNANHAKNYSQFIDILSNPLAKGLDRVWKDSYPDELARFEQDVLRDDKIIPNGGIFKTRIFVPKQALFTNAQQRERNDLKRVRQELGTLWVLGYKFQKGAVQNIATSP